MDNKQQKELAEIANSIRRDVVRMTGIARSGHIASSLSIVDILAVLYWDIMKVSPEDPYMHERDRFILSKGSGCSALYAALSRKGFFAREELWNYRRLGAMLQGQPETPRTPGIDSPSGSHSMGLGIAGGMGLFLKREEQSSRVYCLAGDQELDDGSMWESMIMISRLDLDNVILIIDRNIENRRNNNADESAVKMRHLEDKIRPFGWRTATVDGHSHVEISEALGRSVAGGPLAVIAKTVPGKGISFIEEMAEEGKSPELTRILMDNALSELNRRADKTEGPF